MASPDIHLMDPWHIPLINTLILLLSGTTVTWAHHALLEGNRKELIQGLWCTVGLGVVFTGFQVYEYMHADFSFSGHIYGATFYMATGFHGFHVLIGTIFLIVCLGRSIAGHFKSDHHFGFELLLGIGILLMLFGYFYLQQFMFGVILINTLID